MFTTYLGTIGLSELAALSKRTSKQSLLTHLPKEPPFPLSAEQVRELYTYSVPELTPDGSCSVLGHLASEPYTLTQIFQLHADWKKLQAHPRTKQLWWLHQVAQEIFQKTQLDWFGIYLKQNTVEGKPVLVKVAYQGRPSRAEFPLTAEFAAHSNNATVGLTGKAVYFQNLAQYTGPYYECDVHVKSECCLPILDYQGQVIGILDAESFTENFFSPAILLLIAQTAWELSEYLEKE